VHPHARPGNARARSLAHGGLNVAGPARPGRGASATARDGARYDAVIVGASLAGCTAAILLAGTALATDPLWGVGCGLGAAVRAVARRRPHRRATRRRALEKGLKRYGATALARYAVTPP
jgi:hypothetical protein